MKVRRMLVAFAAAFMVMAFVPSVSSAGNPPFCYYFHGHLFCPVPPGQ